MSNPARPSVLVAMDVMYYESIIGLTVTATLLTFVSRGIWEKRAELYFWRYPVHRAIVWIFCLLLTTLLYFLLQCLQYARRYKDTAACNLLASPWIPLFWVLSKQFTYIFFYERSLITTKSLRLRSNNIVAFRRGLKFVILVGIPVAFYWTFFILYKGKVLQPEGCCVLVTTNPAPVIALAVVDFLLSSCLLFLFIYPLRHHVKVIRKSLASPWESSSSLGEDLIMRVLRRNLALGVVAMSATFMALIAMDVLLTVAYDTTTPRDMEHLQIYASFAIGIDLLISAWVTLSVTNFWKPEFLARFTWCTSVDTPASETQPPLPGTTPSSGGDLHVTPFGATTAPAPDGGGWIRDMSSAGAKLAIYRMHQSTQMIVIPNIK